MAKPYPKPVKQVKKGYVRRNKYNNKKQTYNGRSYDSILECKHAQELDWLLKSGEVIKWEPQHKISLDINGVHIANYFIDFKVWFKDGRIEFHEVKGMETEVWKMKWKITKAIFPDYNLVLLK